MDKLCYEKILKKYCKYIVHIRQQYRSQHLGLVFGAGASIGLGFPNWVQLVKEIMVNDEIKNLPFSYDEGKDAISNAQRLFQTYKAKQFANCSEENKEYNRIEMIIRSGWQKIVHSALYKNIASDINKLVTENHFLRTYIEIREPLKTNTKIEK